MIHYMEKNVHGVWVIYGSIGIRRYFFTNKREAMRLYRREAKQTPPMRPVW